jgi:hypothetical protein
VEGQGRFQVRPERVGAGFSRAPRRRSFLFAHLIQFYKRTMLLKFSSLQVGAFFNRYRFRCKIASGILLYRQGQKSVSYCIVRSFVSPTIPKVSILLARVLPNRAAESERPGKVFRVCSSRNRQPFNMGLCRSAKTVGVEGFADGLRHGDRKRQIREIPKGQRFVGRPSLEKLFHRGAVGKHPTIGSSPEAVMTHGCSPNGCGKLPRRPLFEDQPNPRSR